MMKTYRKLLPALLLGPLCALMLGSALAADPERRRINAEKAAAESRHRAAEAECRQRFVVMACIDEAKAQRRKELALLRERELIIDDADRVQRAEARREAIAAKKALAAQRAASSPAPKASAPRAAMAAPSASHAASAPHVAPAPLDGGPRQAAERAATTAQRQQEAQARRERIASREKKRADEKAANAAALKKSAPLPALPGSAATAPRP